MKPQILLVLVKMHNVYHHRKSILFGHMLQQIVKIECTVTTSLHLQHAQHFSVCNIPFYIAGQSQFESIIPTRPQSGYSLQIYKALWAHWLDTVFDYYIFI